jgi:hypothetical protein
MATEQAKFQSICPFVVQYQKSVATNRAPAAVEKNIKTAAAALRNEIWKAAEQRRTPRRKRLRCARNPGHVLDFDSALAL